MSPEELQQARDTLDEVNREEIQQPRLVWNDEFDDDLDLSRISGNPGFSQKQLFQLQRNALHQNASDHLHGELYTRNAHLIDGCFVKGPFEGFVAILTAALMLGLVAMTVAAIYLRLDSWWSKQYGKQGYCLLAVVTRLPEADMKTEV